MSDVCTSLTQLAALNRFTPVLILIPTEESTPNSFETKFRPPLNPLDQLDAKLDRATLLDAGVYPLIKRRGGAFPDRIGIGRARGVDVTIPLSGISKYHAYISTDDNTYMLTDAGSRNGTWADGMRVTSAAAPLNNESEVLLAAIRFLFLTSEGLRDMLSELNLT